MKKLFFTALLCILSVSVFPQKIDTFISMFADQECFTADILSEEEWKFARYVFSRIDPPFYDMDKSEQLKDTVNSAWFNKVFTYEENGYSFDFRKVKVEFAKISNPEIPEVKEFVFIGMKMPLLEKAESIALFELKGCTEAVKEKFWKEFDTIKPSYEVLVSQEENGEKNIIMKSTEEEPFSEFILLTQNRESSIALALLKGKFNVSDLTPPKDWDE